MKRTVVGAVLLGTAALSVGTAPAQAAPSAADRRERVVVQSTGDRADAVRAVRAAGGVVTRDLPIVDGVSATLPAAARARVAAAPGVLAVTDDLPVATAATGDDPRSGEQPVLVETGAESLQASGTDGRGSVVALIDTGVSPVPDLAGRVLQVADPDDPSAPARDCVNFSAEPTCDDGYGHGTFVAGLIAGTGASSGGKYRGAAPGAKLVSLKIAGRNGAADVTKVLAAIQWTVSFRDTYGIDVLNLSLGTDADTDPAVDPLNRAVQRATAAGITVVVAAGNSGTASDGSGTVFKPGDDPTVLTVGAVDDLGTGSREDDRVPAFTSRGPTAQGLAKPDLVAPGAHLVSLRVPGSFVDDNAPVAGRVGAEYRKGSGSSFATAVVSGLAALVAQAQPTWSPERIKAALVATADPARLGQPRAVGAGIARASAAVRSSALGTPAAVSPAALGTVEGARGTVRVVRTECSELERLLDERCTTGIEGETRAQSDGFATFDAQEFVGTWDPVTWYESQWSGNSWLGNSWLGNSWLGNSWLGNSWLGDSSGGDSSYGSPIPGSAFYGTPE